MELQLQMKEMIAKSPPNRIEGVKKKWETLPSANDGTCVRFDD